MARRSQHRSDSEESERDTITLKTEMSSGRHSNDSKEFIKNEPLSRSGTPLSLTARAKTAHSSAASTPRVKFETEDLSVDPDTGLTAPGTSSKMASSSKKSNRGSKGKNPPRVAPLFDHLPEATEDANKSYTVIDSCIYQNKYLGFTEHAMECDCQEEWGMFMPNS